MNGYETYLGVIFGFAAPTMMPVRFICMQSANKNAARYGIRSATLSPTAGGAPYENARRGAVAATTAGLGVVGYRKVSAEYYEKSRGKFER